MMNLKVTSYLPNFWIDQLRSGNTLDATAELLDKDTRILLYDESTIWKKKLLWIEEEKSLWELVRDNVRHGALSGEKTHGNSLI